MAPEVPTVDVVHQPKTQEAKTSADQVDVASSLEGKGSLEETAVVASPGIRRRKGIAFVSSISKNEPVVTRRELWSYYCTLAASLIYGLVPVANARNQYITMATMYDSFQFTYGVELWLDHDMLFVGSRPKRILHDAFSVVSLRSRL